MDRIRVRTRRARFEAAIALVALALAITVARGGDGRDSAGVAPDSVRAAPDSVRAAPDGAQAASDSAQVAFDGADIAASIQVPPPGEHEVLPAPAAPVRVGESLRFSVQWKFAHAGTAWLEVPEIVHHDGRPAFHLVARAESNGFVSMIYKVRNRIESTWDREGRFSWRYAENRREGGYRVQEDIHFDYAAGLARYRNGTAFPIPSLCQDALSAFYYARTQPLPIGGSVIFDYHASRRSLPLEVKVLGRERVHVAAGTFDCVVIEPVLKAGGIFKNKGRLLIWLTADDRRIPVLMRSKVTIGSVDVILQDWKAGT